MGKLVIGTRSFDMTDWDLSDLSGGTSTLESATEADVTGANFRWVITGTGLGSYDANGVPHSGTVTGITMGPAGKVPLVISGISISASDFAGFVGSNDGMSLEAAIFSGDDSFQGRPSFDTLLGFGGDDTFNLAHSGADNAQGGDGNDVFKMGAALTAADQIDGGAGNDQVILDGTYSGLVFSATTMVNVENVTLRPGHSFNLTFAASSDIAGQSMTVNGSALHASTTATLDGSLLAGHLRLLGGAGADHLTGGSGVSTLIGGDGDDVITIHNFIAGTTVSGGTGTNTLVLDGDFSTHTDLVRSNVSNIHTFDFAAGHDYDVTIDTSSNHAAGSANQELDVNATALGASDSLTLDWNVGARNDARASGGAGNDVITFDLTKLNSPATTNAVADVSQGGSDTVIGSFSPNGSIAIASFGGAFDSSDVVKDAVIDLNGDYSSNVTINAADRTVLGLDIDGAHNYNLTFVNGTLVTTSQFNIIGQSTGAANTLTLDGSAVTDGAQFHLVGGAGTLNFTGTQDGDNLNGFWSLAHIVGGSGNDAFQLYVYSTSDFVDGGGGNDALNIQGAAATYHINGSNMANVEFLSVFNGMDMVVTGNIVASGATMEIESYRNTSGLHFDGSRETTGSFNLVGGVGGNVLAGGANADTIHAGDGGNFMTGNGGADFIVCSPNHTDQVIYKAVSDSTDSTYDTVQNFNSSVDIFKVLTAVTGVDATVTVGALSTASFDTDLAAAVGASQLAAGHAVIFTPDSGTLMSRNFLIVDSNGVAGYQAGQDLVILLDAPNGLTFTTANFTH